MQLTDSTGAVTKTYDYDAFGNEKNPSDTDTNPFRYCGEYYDTETGNYYLRARYYDPGVGRFTQGDTHWNTANMIYGDSEQTLIPQTIVLKQAGNLYAYCANDPVSFADYSGNEAAFVTARYDDNKSLSLHVAVFGAIASVGLTLLVNELFEDDSPILYAKKGSGKASVGPVAMGGTSPASPNPDDDSGRNWEKVTERYLEKMLKKQGTDPHSVKKEYLGQKAEIKKFDIFIDKNSGQLGIFEKTTGKLVDITHYFIK